MNPDPTQLTPGENPVENDPAVIVAQQVVFLSNEVAKIRDYLTKEIEGLKTEIQSIHAHNEEVGNKDEQHKKEMDDFKQSLKEILSEKD